MFISANTGHASEAFTQAQKDWQEGMQQMRSALAIGVQRLNQIHDTYKLGDAKGAALFGGQV